MSCYPTLAVCLAAITLSACSGESAFPVATGEGSVRAINTIPTAPAFSFLIEERLIGNVDFATSSGTTRYDDLEYRFNFEVALAGDSNRTRVASQFLDVVRDKDYTFVISGAVAAPTITVWEADVREWVGDETVFEARFAHGAPTLGDVDVYLIEATDPPTPPLPGASQGALAFGEFLAAADFAAGEYILTVTEANDETAILYQSVPFTPPTATSIILTIFDSDANDLARVTTALVNATGGGFTRLLDSRALPTLRFLHASINGGDTDIYDEDPLVTPRVSNHTFRDVTGDFEVPAGDTPITYTVADNLGSILIDEDFIFGGGTRYSSYFIENGAGEDVIVVAAKDRRAVETIGKVSLINTATNHAAVDIYLVEADIGIDEVQPQFGNLPLGAPPATLPLFPNSYDIYITVPSAKDVIVGPVRLDLAGGDIFDIVIYDNVDPAIADLAFIAPP